MSIVYFNQESPRHEDVLVAWNYSPQEIRLHGMVRS
jgi:hypothetical protein